MRMRSSYDTKSTDETAFARVTRRVATSTREPRLRSHVKRKRLLFVLPLSLGSSAFHVLPFAFIKRNYTRL